jgi:hypothetical protein
MKKIVFYLIISVLFISCDTNEDNNLNTVCNSKFFSFVSTDNFASAGDVYGLYKYTKSNVIDVANFTNISPSGFTFSNYDYLTNSNTFTNASNDKIYCLTPVNSTFIQFDKIANSATFTNIFGLNLSSPFEINGVVRFCKLSNVVITNSPITFRNYISKFDFSIVDISGNVVFGPYQNIVATESDNIENRNQGAHFINGKVFILLGSSIGILDTNTNNFSLRKLYNYDYLSNRQVNFGLKKKDANTLVFAKAEIIPTNTIKIEKIDINTLLSSSSIYTPVTLINYINATISNQSANVGQIINRSDNWTLAFDVCDDNYYITYPDNSTTTSADAFMLEFKPNTNSVINYPLVASRHVFGLEINQ